jgi:hypothetical protein
MPDGLKRFTIYNGSAEPCKDGPLLLAEDALPVIEKLRERIKQLEDTVEMAQHAVDSGGSMGRVAHALTYANFKTGTDWLLDMNKFDSRESDGDHEQ